MAQLRVILVDDSALFLDAAARFLSRDARVLVVGRARGGEEGVRLAEELEPDLVLMDLVMPGMDGLAATRLIKAGPVPPCVVIVTLWDRPEARLSADAAGADLFVCKSQFTSGTLAVIDSLLAGPTGLPA